MARLAARFRVEIAPPIGSVSYLTLGSLIKKQEWLVYNEERLIIFNV